MNNGEKRPDSRDPSTGRFAPGNQVAKGMIGNPASRARRLRKAIVDRVSTREGYWAQLADAMLDDALTNRLSRLDLLNLMIGKAENTETKSRLDHIEQLLLKLKGAKS